MTTLPKWTKIIYLTAGGSGTTVGPYSIETTTILQKWPNWVDLEEASWEILNGDNIIYAVVTDTMFNQGLVIQVMEDHTFMEISKACFEDYYDITVNALLTLMKVDSLFRG